MIKTKLIELLKTFSPSEFNEFGKFIHSPLHNESRMMLKLYSSLKKFYPAFDNIGLTKEKIYCEMYGNVEYDDKKFRERSSDLHGLAEDYLSWMDYRRNPIAVKRHAMTQFSKRGLEVDFNKKFKEIQTMLDKMRTKNENYFYFQHEQLNEKRSFYESRVLFGKRKPYYDDLEEEFEQFSLYFVVKMLTYYILMYNRESVLKYDFKYKHYEPVMKFINENNYDRYPIIKSLYLVLKLVKNDKSEKVYYELKKYVTKNVDLIEMDYKKLIFTQLFIYTQESAYKEKPGFEKERFDIIRLQLQHQVYPVENEKWMELGFFLSSVIVSISMNSLEWTTKFINDYSHKVNPRKRENACSFVRASLHYAEKKFDIALKDLSKIKGGDFHYYIIVKTLLSKIYFERKEFESVLALIDSFKYHLNSNPMIPESLIRKNTNFTTLLRRLTLLSLAPERDQYNVDKLVNEIKNFSFEELSNKSWLLVRVLELKENKKRN